MPAPPSDPLVVALVGTDHHPFDRLVRWMDDWAAERSVRVVVQHGSARPPESTEGVRLFPLYQLESLLADAARPRGGGPGAGGGGAVQDRRGLAVALDEALAAPATQRIPPSARDVTATA